MEYGQQTRFAAAPNQQDAYGTLMKPRVFKIQHMWNTRYNACAIFLAVLIPYGIFAATFTPLSLHLHYESLLAAWTIAICMLLVVLAFGLLTYLKGKHYLRDLIHQNDTSEDLGTLYYYGFIFFTGLVLWITAVSAGCVLFNSYFERYYDVVSHGTYEGVNPAKTQGETVMDAGRSVFVPGSYLDLRMSSTFSHNGIYCVAPITFGNRSLGAYDFWAVGENCCNPLTGEFQCGAYGNPSAHSGLRVFDQTKQAYYRLAVKQAESKYKIQSLHPLFFHWEGPDAFGEIDKLRRDGMLHYVLGLTIAFGFQLVVVIVAAVGYGKDVAAPLTYHRELPGNL